MPPVVSKSLGTAAGNRYYTCDFLYIIAKLIPDLNFTNDLKLTENYLSAFIIIQYIKL